MVQKEQLFDTHHLRYPRRDYLGNRIMRMNRNLPCNKIRLPRDLHEEVHRNEPTPVKLDFDQAIREVEMSLYDKILLDKIKGEERKRKRNRED